MEKTDQRYHHFIQILREELVPAMGCTEPIAIAYAAAKAREVLGRLPERILVEASGNIIKNVKSVVVPNTGGLKGIEASAAAGAVAGDAGKILEVISQVTDAQKKEIKSYLAGHEVRVAPAPGDVVFDIIVTLVAGADTVRLRIADYHTNIVLIEKNGEILLESGNVVSDSASGLTDRSCMSVEAIVDFVNTCDIEDVQDIVQRQIDYNYAIAQEGMAHDWGANIGKVLRQHYGDDIKIRARAMAAAGSDARMSGCEMPVIIVSGSGNQGITASVPVIEYAKELQVSHEAMLRAVTLSDLLTIHMKTGIGRLSAYCGAVSAGCGAGAAIAYLNGGGFTEIAHTLVNALATISGMICDGAKPSCAAKIAAAVDAGLLGYNMYLSDQQFRGGEGIVSKGVENTIANIGRLGRLGMRETDREIIRIMTGQPPKA
ncbi:serine dehydratase subunit alpha family protein [uncultured Oscillibacter sp.]|uniref:L-cysteine desulfidase family protein n=2 Tax=uncultured Oscillibacter sp. TaxID=876091 RepID=UPI00261049BC|nr:L-serine ammonia-lyase, iron-sulfur-dependent, subunit alpha [uncultured Oscillibacter sp.]